MPSHIIHTYIPSESSWWCFHLNIHNTLQHHHLFILNNATSSTVILIDKLLFLTIFDMIKNLLIWCFTKFCLKDQLPIAMLLTYWYVKGIILCKTIHWIILMKMHFHQKWITCTIIFIHILQFSARSHSCNKFYFNFD